MLERTIHMSLLELGIYVCFITIVSRLMADGLETLIKRLRK